MHTKTEATTTTTYKPSLIERMRGAKTTRATRPASTRSTRGMTGTTGTTTTNSTGVGRRHNHNHATGTTVTPRRQQRKTTLGDKVVGAFMKAKGDATGRPGQKVC
jgi:hypothetical protein